MYWWAVGELKKAQNYILSVISGVESYVIGIIVGIGNWAANLVNDLRLWASGIFTYLENEFTSNLSKIPLVISSALVNFQKAMTDGATWFIWAVLSIIDPILNDIAVGMEKGFEEETGFDI